MDIAEILNDPRLNHSNSTGLNLRMNLLRLIVAGRKKNKETWAEILPQVKKTMATRFNAMRHDTREDYLNSLSEYYDLI